MPTHSVIDCDALYNYIDEGQNLCEDGRQLTEQERLFRALEFMDEMMEYDRDAIEETLCRVFFGHQPVQGYVFSCGMAQVCAGSPGNEKNFVAPAFQAYGGKDSSDRQTAVEHAENGYRFGSQGGVDFDEDSITGLYGRQLRVDYQNSDDPKWVRARNDDFDEGFESYRIWVATEYRMKVKQAADDYFNSGAVDTTGWTPERWAQETADYLAILAIPEVYKYATGLNGLTVEDEVVIREVIRERANMEVNVNVDAWDADASALGWDEDGGFTFTALPGEEQAEDEFDPRMSVDWTLGDLPTVTTVMSGLTEQIAEADAFCKGDGSGRLSTQPGASFHPGKRGTAVWKELGLDKMPDQFNRAGSGIVDDIPQPAAGEAYLAFLQEWYAYETFTYNCKPADPIAGDKASQQVYDEMVEAYAKEIELRFEDLRAEADALLVACGAKAAPVEGE